MAGTLASVIAVETSSVLILALCAFVQWRSGGLGRLRTFLRDAALIGAAGWLAEDLCIRLFSFYGYAPGWTARLDRVPLLIGAIWPFVILSARDVARALWGEGRFLPLAAGLLILFDAALVEPVAVRAGLWSWSESALFGVPLIGLAGWGAFGAICLALLRWKPWAVPLLAPPLVNAALVVLWWGAFRWGPREELPTAAPLVVAIAAAAALLFSLRRKRGALPLEVALPRAAAALLFFVLAALCGDRRLWAYAAVFVLPWLWVFAPSRRRPAAAEAA